MLKKILIAALWLPLAALAQTYPSPTFQSLTVLGTLTNTGGVSLSSLASQAANTVVANVMGSAASPTAFVMPSCATTGNALQWTNGSGFTCANTGVGTVAQYNVAVGGASGSLAFVGPSTSGYVLTSNGSSAYPSFQVIPAPTILGLVSSYNGVATVANGIPAEYAQINLTAQTASVASATLYAVPSSGAGFYVAIVDTICTTAGTAGTVSTSLGWNNGSASASAATGPMSLSTLGSETTQIFTVYSAASQNITYSTTVSGATGSPQYSIRIRLLYLG